MVDEALDFYEKANGRDRTQKRQELENMRPGELRRSLEQSAEFQTHEEGGLRKRLRAQGSVQWQGR